ncbi:putative C-_U-editing enzyme APOBEC-4 [Gastrophryne carolinensis]
METVFQEFAGKYGFLVKPYKWLYPNQYCTKCPYHIKTGEESRVTFKDFYESFGFPYGPTINENKQLIFYEIKAFNGALIQRGQVTNCTSFNIHAETFLFVTHGYLDYILGQNNSVGYITLYTNFTPCNEYGHYCISKMYNMLMTYTQTRLDIYFSHMYHTTEGFPSAAWNKEALRSLASHWTRVTLNPLSDGIWKTVLYNFVKDVPENTLHQPILPIRASADSYNAYMIHLITGVKPYYVENPPVLQPEKPSYQPKYQEVKMNNNVVPQRPNIFSQFPPFFNPYMSFIPALQTQRELMSKPKQVVRHLNMPIEFSEEITQAIPTSKKMKEVVIKQQVKRSKSKEGTKNTYKKS